MRRTFMHYLEGMTLHQIALLTLAVFVVGFICMIGFGSRTKY